jgi:hypothetical protein
MRIPIDRLALSFIASRPPDFDSNFEGAPKIDLAANLAAPMQPPIILPQKPEARRRRVQRKLSACAIRNTANSSPPSLASCAAACRPRRTISASPNRALWGARSVTSTRSRSVACITAIFTPTAIKPLGGLRLASIRCP